MNVINSVPFLRTQRNFPEEIKQLTVECDKAYVDTANAVNARTIGVFPSNVPAITGESWFVVKNARQQSLRKAFTFTGAGNIPHGISFIGNGGFTRIYGTFTDGTNWYPLPYVDIALLANQINVKITPTNIVITAGATAPTIVSGFFVLEWLAQA
jgi:hypothetical protein